MLLRSRKYATLITNPAYWPALLRGVGATVEHDPALGKRAFATIFDVGANKGQFAAYALARWPSAYLICYEPLPGPRRKLVALTRGRAEVHGYALGAENTEGRIHLASRIDSSSLLALSPRQKAIFGVETRGAMPVQIKRLDGSLNAMLARPSLLKIDVQGFELQVLKGATGMLPQVDAVYVEASFVELYHGQPLKEEIQGFLEQAGFRLEGRFNQHLYRGKPVQADLLFIRASTPR